MNGRELSRQPESYFLLGRGLRLVLGPLPVVRQALGPRTVEYSESFLLWGVSHRTLGHD